MNAIHWWLADFLSGMLEPGEREAVRGDFAESGETGGQALRDVAGLVARRQAALWKDWRPWLVLAALVVPLGMLLSLVSRNMAAGSALPIWMYFGNWTWTYLTNPGARIDLFRYGGAILFQYTMLFCWSWTGGLLVRSVARSTIPVHSALFCVALLLGEFSRIPRYLGNWLLLPARGGNHAVFASVFYYAIFPEMFFAVLVVIPALWGMHRGATLAKLPVPRLTILWACSAAALFALATENWIWWQARTWNLRLVPFPHLPALLPLAVLGPIGYRLATARTFLANRKETNI